MAKLKPEKLLLLDSFDIESPPVEPRIAIETSNLDVERARSDSVIPDYINPQIAYLLGFIRDGSVSGTLVEIKQQSSSELLQKVIAPIFHYNFNKNVKENNGRIIFKDKKIASFLKIIGNYERGCFDTPGILEMCSEPIIKWYIRGFWDAEGGCPHVLKYVERGKKIPVMITITQCWNNAKECPPLEYISEQLSFFGIKSQLHLLSKKDAERKYPRFRLAITSYQNIVSFNDIIGSSHPKKGMNLIMLSESLRLLLAAKA